MVVARISNRWTGSRELIFGYRGLIFFGGDTRLQRVIKYILDCLRTELKCLGSEAVCYELLKIDRRVGKSWTFGGAQMNIWFNSCLSRRKIGIVTSL